MRRHKILYVVHRYPPYPGGSEYFVRNMAEESKRRGDYVCILTDAHRGLSGQNVDEITSEYNRLLDSWDMIVVHGADVITQNIALLNSFQLQSPMLYMLIKPSLSEISMRGMKSATYLGYSTSADLEHISDQNLLHKARYVRHGISELKDYGSKEDVRKELNIDDSTQLFVSGGGFASNKRMRELGKRFSKIAEKNQLLHCYGYWGNDVPEENDHVRVFRNAEFDDFQKAMVASDMYLMYSSEEGYGLVLLEAMWRNKPWLAMNIAGAHDLFTKHNVGEVANTDDEFFSKIESFSNSSQKIGYQNLVKRLYMIKNTVDDIDNVIEEYKQKGSP